MSIKESKIIDPENSLAAFSPPVRAWFQETLGQPTPPQAQGWPAIQRGEHTVILAPTGSGKTLAAFLWGIDQLYREWTDLYVNLVERGAPPPSGLHPEQRPAD